MLIMITATKLLLPGLTKTVQLSYPNLILLSRISLSNNRYFHPPDGLPSHDQILHFHSEAALYGKPLQQNPPPFRWWVNEKTRNDRD